MFIDIKIVTILRLGENREYIELSFPMSSYSFDEANRKCNNFITTLQDDLQHEYPLTILCFDRGPEYEGLEEESPDTGGGGSGGSSTVQVQSGKEAIRKIFDFNKSNLTQEQLAELEAALDKLIETFPELCKILSEWDGAMLGFQFGEVTDYAQYKPADKTVTFKKGGEIKPNFLLEELLHATQHNLYGAEMVQAHRNVEFEVKVFQDLINLKNGAGHGTVGIWGMDYPPSYVKSYNEYIVDIIKGTPFNINVYNELYQGWKGYEGKPSSGDFDPELIQKHF